MVTAVVIVALIVCLTGAIYTGKNIRLTEYVSSRKRGTFAAILLTSLSTMVGGWMVFGLCQVGYEAGIVGYIIGAGYAAGILLLAINAKRIKELADELHCDTIDDFVGVRYGRTAQILTTIINLTLFLAVVAGQFISMSAFLQIFTDLESVWAFYVAVGVVIAYTAFSGFKGVLFTDAWQFYVLSAATLIVFLVLTFTANWSAIGSLDATYFNGTGYGPLFLIGPVILPFTLFVRSDFWQRISCAKDVATVRRAFYVVAPLLLVFYVVMTTIGIYARAALGEGVANPAISGYILFIDKLQGGNPVLVQLLLSLIALGVFAALLSTADSYLNIVAVSLSKLLHRNQWKEFEKGSATIQGNEKSELERKLLLSARIVTLLLGVVSILVAKLIPDLVNLMVAGYSAIMVMLPAVLATLFWKQRRKTSAAVASIIAGFVVFLPLLWVFSNPKIAFLPGVLVSAIVYAVVALFAKDYSEQENA